MLTIEGREVQAFSQLTNLGPASAALKPRCFSRMYTLKGKRRAISFYLHEGYPDVPYRIKKGASEISTAPKSWPA